MSSSWNYVQEVSKKFQLSGISPSNTPPQQPAVNTAQQEQCLQSLLLMLRDFASSVEDSEDSGDENPSSSQANGAGSGGVSPEQFHQVRSQMIRSLDIIPSLLPVFDAHGWNGSTFESIR
jgi:hypothetical protein